jgi:hypothetical protein
MFRLRLDINASPSTSSARGFWIEAWIQYDAMTNDAISTAIGGPCHYFDAPFADLGARGRGNELNPSNHTTDWAVRLGPVGAPIRLEESKHSNVCYAGETFGTSAWVFNPSAFAPGARCHSDCSIA